MRIEVESQVGQSISEGAQLSFPGAQRRHGELVFATRARDDEHEQHGERAHGQHAGLIPMALSANLRIKGSRPLLLHLGCSVFKVGQGHVQVFDMPSRRDVQQRGLCQAREGGFVFQRLHVVLHGCGHQRAQFADGLGHLEALLLDHLGADVGFATEPPFGVHLVLTGLNLNVRQQLVDTLSSCLQGFPAQV